MNGGLSGTRVSWSKEEDGSLLLAEINKMNEEESQNVSICTSIFTLSSGDREMLRKTAMQMLDILDNRPEATHMAIEIHSCQVPKFQTPKGDNNGKLRLRSVE